MPIKLANNASGTLATAISASDTGIALTTGDGAEFPTLGVGDYFYATITSSGGTQEIVKVTARVGDAMTVVRAQEGTTAASFAAGSRFELRVTAQSVVDLVDQVAAVSSITINVPSQFATIQAVFGWLANKTIAADATVTIKVADGIYDYTGSAVIMNHPQGSRIRVIGNETTPTNCTLTWTNTTSGVDGLVVSNGNTLGYINGFHITRNPHAGTRISTGLLAHNGATIICGPKMQVSNHYYGIAARMGSYIYAPNAIVSGAGDVGIWAFVGSSIDCPNANVSSTSDPLRPLGFGIQAEYGSALNCRGASASGNKVAGIAALSNSTVRAHSCTASNNIGSGFFARDGSVIVNHDSRSNNNGRYGEERIYGGEIKGNNVVASGNTLGSYSGYWYDSSEGGFGARIAANGHLRIDNNQTGSTFFNTSGGLQFEVFHTNSSNSWVGVTGGNNNPQIRSLGSGSNIDLSLIAKGDGDVFVGGQKRTFLRLRATNANFAMIAPEGVLPDSDISIAGKGAGYVFLGNNRNNYIRINPAASGNSPQVRAEGSDTNIDIFIGGKGNGVVRFGTWSSSADAPINGFITIKDEAGNIRKLATIA